MKAGGRTFRRKLGPLYRDRGAGKGKDFRVPRLDTPGKQGSQRSHGWLGASLAASSHWRGPASHRTSSWPARGAAPDSPEASGWAGGGSQLLT